MTTEEYRRTGYRTADGGYRPEIFTEEARWVAQELMRQNATTHAVRRFYQQVKAIEYLMDHGQRFDPEVWRLARLEPQAQYAVTRQILPVFFATVFIPRNRQWATRSWPDYQGFVYHFESVVAYLRDAAGPAASSRGRREDR